MEFNYKQAWLNTIHNGGKLWSYADFKRDFFLEKYLLQESLVNRKNLTRLRISSHKLSVETGRFNKTPLENRLCAMCDKGLVEDEFHFMISCTAYEKPRGHLFKYLSSFTLRWMAPKTATSATPFAAVTWPRSRINTSGPNPLGFDWEGLAASRGTAGGHSGRPLI